MNQTSIISPKILKGFRDFLPAQQTIRNHCINCLQEVFARFCYVPIDTPLLEYEEVLLGKGGGETDKQVYRFSDRGKRDVALRFDLTVPFARFVTMHQHELHFPFARYHIGKVFRGENTQRGRYREFIQCDFDIIGSDTVSADLTIIETIVSAFQSLGVYSIKIHISHREIITFLLKQESLPTKIDVMRIIDKTKKIGKDAVLTQLKDIVSEHTYETLVSCLYTQDTVQLDSTEALVAHNTNVLKTIRTHVGDHNSAYIRLQAIIQALSSIGLESCVVLDTSITRGLDYYTGLVCETFVNNFENVGSVCSGGRYNDLTGLYNKKSMPGVGASVGLDRLLSIFEKNIPVPKHVSIAICPMEQQSIAYCHSIMRILHTHSYHALVYSSHKTSNTTTSLQDFFKFTDNTKPTFTIVIGNEEYEQNTITIKYLRTKKQLRNIDIDTGLTFIHEQSTTTQ